MLEADTRQGAAATGILHARPGKGRVQIITAVEEDRSRLELIAERFGAYGVRGINGRGETECTVIHEPHGFLVRRWLCHWRRTPEPPGPALLRDYDRLRAASRRARAARHRV